MSKYHFSIKETVLELVPILHNVYTTTTQMKWLSVLALCAALFIAATHASQLQDKEGMMDRAVEEKLLQILLANQQDAEIENEIEFAEAAINRGIVTKKLSNAQKKAFSQCLCLWDCEECSWK